MYLFHVFGPMDQEDDLYKALKKRIEPHDSLQLVTKGGGGLFPEVIASIKAGDSDEWMDFTQAFSVYFSPMTFSHYLRVTLPEDKVYVFNRDITTDLFAYVEDEYMEDEAGPGFVTQGLPTKDTLMQQFWESRMPLPTYLKEEPYPNPELLVFESIPPHLLEGFIVGKKVSHGDVGNGEY